MISGKFKSVLTVKPRWRTAASQFPENDLEKLGWEINIIGKNEKCKKGYKLAWAIHTSNFFEAHYMRQNPDGSWSHKPNAVDVDLPTCEHEGGIIYNPEPYFIEHYYNPPGYKEIVPPVSRPWNR